MYDAVNPVLASVLLASVLWVGRVSLTSRWFCVYGRMGLSFAVGVLTTLGIGLLVVTLAQTPTTNMLVLVGLIMAAYLGAFYVMFKRSWPQLDDAVERNRNALIDKARRAKEEAAQQAEASAQP